MTTAAAGRSSGAPPDQAPTTAADGSDPPRQTAPDDLPPIERPLGGVTALTRSRRLTRAGSGQSLVMWLFLTRRFRTWVLITFLVPLATGLLRRVGEALQRRNGPTSVSNGLLKAGELGDRARARLGGGRRRR